jgi:hypothetical protein
MLTFSEVRGKNKDPTELLSMSWNKERDDAHVFWSKGEK